MANYSADALWAFEVVCRAFDQKGWKYHADNEKLTLITSFTGDDLSMPMSVTVDDERGILRVYSYLPLTFPEDKIPLGAYATHLANWQMINGAFDFNVQNGKMLFRIVQSYRGRALNEEVVRYMINVTANTVDNFNDKLADLAEGKMDYGEYVAFIEQGQG